MGLLVAIFIIGLAIYLLPQILIRLLPWLVKRRMKKAFREAYGDSARYNRQKDTPPQPKRPKKKIDPSVGEYVRFEEVKISVDTTQTSTQDNDRTSVQTDITVEEQIVDVEWEEIPDSDKNQN